MRLEVFILQCVRGVDAAAVIAGTHDHEGLIEVGRQLAPMLALPIAGKGQRVDEVEDLLVLVAPAPRFEFVRRNARAAQQLLDLVAGQFGLAVEDAQELA